MRIGKDYYIVSRKPENLVGTLKSISKTKATFLSCEEYLSSYKTIVETTIEGGIINFNGDIVSFDPFRAEIKHKTYYKKTTYLEALNSQYDKKLEELNSLKTMRKQE